MKKPKTAAIVISEVKREYFPTEVQYITEKDALTDAKVIAKYFLRLGIKPKIYLGNSSLSQRLNRDNPGLVLNLVGSVKGKEFLAAAIPGILETLDLPYTGAGILGESLAYNKFLVKKLLEQNGIPVPRYQLFNKPSDKLNSTLRFPLISKLNEIHGSVEITKDAISENEKHLRKRLKFLIKTYDQPVLVEEFIVGREMVCILLEGFKRKVYLAERIFYQQNEKYNINSFESNWVKDYDLYDYEKYSDPLLTEYVKKAFEITDMADYGKFDVRLDDSGRYFFIDSNSNPAFGPVELETDLANVLHLYKINFLQILRRVILNTMNGFNT